MINSSGIGEQTESPRIPDGNAGKSKNAREYAWRKNLFDLVRCRDTPSIPYFASPRIGCPIADRCTRA